jgi:hypothetical protein
MPIPMGDLGPTDMGVGDVSGVTVSGYRISNCAPLPRLR